MPVNLKNDIFNLLTSKGERLPEVYNWLTANVWSDKNYNSKSALEYLEEGEKTVLKLEEVIQSSASAFYNEIVSASLKNSCLLSEFNSGKTAIVVFDGLSIREVPVLRKLASDTGFEISNSDYRIAGLPSDTTSFIEQNLLGKKIGPSQLESRKELKEQNIKVYYYDSPIRYFNMSENGQNYLLWSSFPDGTYTDFNAKNSVHFETIIKQFDVAWKNTILTIPSDYRIIITSDHGYIYLNAGFESNEKAEPSLKFLNQERFRYIEENETVPYQAKDIQYVAEKNLAMLRGRIKNRPKGHSSNKVFRHGGLSIMEMLTPMLELRKK